MAFISPTRVSTSKQFHTTDAFDCQTSLYSCRENKYNEESVTNWGRQYGSNENNNNRLDFLKRTAATTVLTLAPMFFTLNGEVSTTSTYPFVPSLLSNIPIVQQQSVANAADYGSLNDEQKLIAEAWRLIDYSYLDRTFNGQDWFKVRQDSLAKAKKFKSMNEAYTVISEIASSLGDKYTRYLSPAKYQSIVDSATGDLVGVGVELSTNANKNVMASDVEPNSPADKAGLKPNDVFVEVDGTKFLGVNDVTPDDVATKLRGEKGSKVGVTVQRGGTDGKVVDFIITREPIKITSVKSYVNGKVGVIRIKSFSGTTSSLVTNVINDFQKKNVKTIVLDLRNNPGGLLPGGTDTAALFLDENKPLVYVVNKNGVVDTTTTLQKGILAPDDGAPKLIIYVNGNTASAAEVLTAALQENKRATVVGEQTFGKGIVQTIRPLSNNNGGIAITVQRYETPNHNNINKKGIAVDVATNVDCPNDDAIACIPKSVL